MSYEKTLTVGTERKKGF